MPTLSYSESKQTTYTVVTWASITNGDDGALFQPPNGYTLESIQYIGTIGTNPALKIQGSNDAGTTWAELATAAALGALVPSGQTLAFRPAVVGGSGTTVTAIAFFRRTL